MALTKVTKTGITDNAIDADKIEDGTIVASDIAPGTITNAKLAGSIANDKLANSSITVNGSSVSLGGSVSAGKVQWQAVKTADFNAVAGEGYFVDTDSVGAVTATLPGSPSAGDTIAFKDYAANFGTNSLTIARNGNNIQGVANDSLISTNRASVVLVYIDATKGWLYTNESNVADLGEPLFTSATGGTITTSGDFKIHTFTGDGCFAVSQAGNGSTVPAGGPSNVDYLVVAGGGAGYSGAASGGGGAGGYRTTFPSPGCNAGAFPISATTYPITVGGGGPAGSVPVSPVPGPTVATIGKGSDSIFSTITSTGGGPGGSNYHCGVFGAGQPGGSGGGGGQIGPTRPARPAGGTGNTPPVSPSQGNPGGLGALGPLTSGAYQAGGGGGGAGGAGADSIPQGGNGGAGSANSISGSSVTYAGGGGGGINATGGSGGGGNSGSNGTANTGGGGGGPNVFDDASQGGTGGKGIVIIRYKFQ
jgi:hypothetical protein